MKQKILKTLSALKDTTLFNYWNEMLASEDCFKDYIYCLEDIDEIMKDEDGNINVYSILKDSCNFHNNCNYFYFQSKRTKYNTYEEQIMYFVDSNDFCCPVDVNILANFIIFHRQDFGNVLLKEILKEK